MSEATHTAGPWEMTGKTIILGANGELVAGKIREVQEHFLETPPANPQEVTEANSQFITSACNSYDRHCGPRAVECAEADLLGKALEALKAADHAMTIAKPRSPRDPSWDTARQFVGEVLSKTQGGGG